MSLRYPRESHGGKDSQSHENISLQMTDPTQNPLLGSENIVQPKITPRPAMASPMSPRRRRAMERESMIEKVRHMVSSPFPYMILILLVVMIVMIFVDVMPIAGTINVLSMHLVILLSAQCLPIYLFPSNLMFFATASKNELPGQ